ncbi:MAG: sugar phosphate isomerase/epimerase [Phycisphaerales bacterium]|nr:MAG: sugar phosphate isomerase/epimerase [Phycisphaerales bacterium]
MTNKEQARRQFLQLAGAGAAASLIRAESSSSQTRRSSTRRRSIKPLFQLGLASYTLKEFNLDQTLAMTRKVGLKYICFKSFHLALDSTPAQIQAAVAKVKEAGLTLYGGGVISMRKQDQVDQAFDYAKTAGMRVIIGAPAPEMLSLIEKKVKQYDIKVAIHNHGPGDRYFPTPAVALEQLKNLDKRIGMCHDIGHTKRYGADPIAETELCAGRLHDVHIKDVSAANKAGKGVEIGRGVIDIPRFIRTLVRMKYAGIVSFEYEKDEKNPLAGLAESVGYVKGVIAAL